MEIVALFDFDCWIFPVDLFTRSVLHCPFFQKYNADYDLSAKEGADTLAFVSLLEEKLLPALVRHSVKGLGVLMSVGRVKGCAPCYAADTLKRRLGERHFFLIVVLKISKLLGPFKVCPWEEKEEALLWFQECFQVNEKREKQHCNVSL